MTYYSKWFCYFLFYPVYEEVTDTANKLISFIQQSLIYSSFVYLCYLCDLFIYVINSRAGC